MESKVIPLHVSRRQARAPSNDADAGSWHANPIARLAELKAERQRVCARICEVETEEKRIRAAMKRPDRTCLPFSAVAPPARRSALYTQLQQHGRNPHAEREQNGAPMTEQGWMLAHVLSTEAALVAAVLRRAARMGHYRSLRAAAIKAEHQLLMQWFIEGREGEKARAAGIPLAPLRRRALAHARRHGTRTATQRVTLAPLASALYKAATAPRARACGAPELDAP